MPALPRFPKTLLASLILVLGLSAGHAGAQDSTQQTYDFAQTSCAQLTELPSEEMGYVLILLFGYASGLSEEPKHTSDSIDQQIKAAVDNCHDHPEMTVVDAFNQ